MNQQCMHSLSHTCIYMYNKQKTFFEKIKYDVGLMIDRDAGEKKGMRTR